MNSNVWQPLHQIIDPRTQTTPPQRDYDVTPWPFIYKQSLNGSVAAAFTGGSVVDDDGVVIYVRGCLSFIVA